MTSTLDIGAEGQATYGMANLRPERTGLPFIIFISQRDDARHAARVKISPAPGVRAGEMGAYAIAPFEHKAGWRLPIGEESALADWIALNRDVLLGYWDGEVAYTEDALEMLRPLRPRK